MIGDAEPPVCGKEQVEDVLSPPKRILSTRRLERAELFAVRVGDDVPVALDDPLVRGATRDDEATFCALRRLIVIMQAPRA
jgi:hypothetical protein